MRHEHITCAGDQTYGCEVFDGIKACCFIEPRVDDLRAIGGEHQCIAVRLGFSGGGCTNVATCAWTVFNDKLLAEDFAEFGGDDTGNGVIGAAGSLWHDD